MNPGGRFAPQSQLSETAKDGALLREFWGATPDLGRGSAGGGGPASLPLTVVKDVPKNVTGHVTDTIWPKSAIRGPQSGHQNGRVACI